MHWDRDCQVHFNTRQRSNRDNQWIALPWWDPVKTVCKNHKTSFYFLPEEKKIMLSEMLTTRFAIIAKQFFSSRKVAEQTEILTIQLYRLWKPNFVIIQLWFMPSAQQPIADHDSIAWSQWRIAKFRTLTILLTQKSTNRNAVELGHVGWIHWLYGGT